jgi:hypothetical protein
MSSTDTAITSGQQVLIPDRPRGRKIERKTTIVINSRDRNILKYPSTNTFRFNLRRPLKDIVTIELVNGCVPGFLYNINTGWNRFTFLEGAVQYTVTLTPGFYTDTQLATHLQTQLNAIGAGNTYTCVPDPNTKKLTITRTVGAAGFSFLFRTGVFKDFLDEYAKILVSVNCPARFLGFGYDDYTDTGGILLAPFPMDSENFLTRMYLYINAESNVDLHRLELSAGRRDCFHIFYLKPGEENYIKLNKDTELALPIYHASPAPISRISFFDVSFRDEFYRPLDLQNRDVDLVLEITHLE